MKKFIIIIFLIVFSCPLGWTKPSQNEQIQKAQKSLVKIKTIYTRTMPKLKQTVSYERNGIGVIIDPNGLILTNAHTINKAPQIFVILADGSRRKAKVVFTSSKYDFCFLKIKAPSKLTTVAWAKSSQTRVGNAIIVMGNSSSIGQITKHIQKRARAGIDYLEVNLNLHKGDSGSPVFDERGRLLGIITAKEKNQDRTSLAIASDKIHQQYLQYLKTLR